ncbi:hypothetical protein M011DRAFT_383131, partial [Sporormia fimetaria CBS 119925]
PTRSRESSAAPSDGAQQPLKNALNHAFDKSDAARTVDPELIAQITAEVKRSVLDEIKMSAGVSGGPVQPQPHAPPQPYLPQSPTSTSASYPSRNVYTPPTPKHPDYCSQGSASPDPLARDPMFDGVGDRPSFDRSAPDDTFTDRKARPSAAPRMESDADFTPIEKMWQLLFDAQGQPTARLGQFLRGLALHIIDDYEPKKSLVISPAKMMKFYEDVKLSDETFAWQTVFGQLPYPTLAKIYREMRCEHHFIQERLADQPSIPALTPDGFQEWMTAMIQAYPDAEYERLSKAVLDMPISNADDSKERFPKELPRRLFPHKENLPAQQRCVNALAVGGVNPLRRAPTFPPPPPTNPATGPSLERERDPYGADSRAVESDEADEPTAVPIERERKPYTATPGGGKVYEDGVSRSFQSDSSHPEMRRRTQSTASQSQWAPPRQQPPNRSNPQGRRPRSPPPSKYGTRSDPDVRDIPAEYYSSNIYPSTEEGRRYPRESDGRRAEWARRQAEDDVTRSKRSGTGFSDTSYDSQPRYDDDYYRGRSNTTSGYDSRGYDSRRY